MGIAGHVPGKNERPQHAIPRKGNRQVQLGEPVLNPAWFEEELAYEQDCGGVEDDLGRPNGGSVSFKNAQPFILRYHFRPP